MYFATVDHRTTQGNREQLSFLLDLGIGMPEAIRHHLYVASLLELGFQLGPEVKLP